MNDIKNLLYGELSKLKTPAFIVDENLLAENMRIVQHIKKATGCKILLALKAFAMFEVFPLLRETLDGVCASSPHEARLGREEFKKEVHVFAAAYSDEDFKQLLKYADHIDFNSFAQFEKFKDYVKKYSNKISFGLRVNPEHSEAPVPLYDPCAKYSRLGIRAVDFKDADLTGIEGLHFHTLCEQDSPALARTLAAFEEKFAFCLSGTSHRKGFNSLKWVNFGGGHHLTREGYDIDLLCRLIVDFQKKYKLEVYLEPGEAIALNAGFLAARVLDIVNNEIQIAILDASAAAHMPDVLEMPYRPDIVNSDMPNVKKHTYRLAGHSCLAGDTIGDYSFDEPLKAGDMIILKDMAHYSMVKTNTFNGLALPSINVIKEKTKKIKTVKKFWYRDFKGRLS